MFKVFSFVQLPLWFFSLALSQASPPDRIPSSIGPSALIKQLAQPDIKRILTRGKLRVAIHVDDLPPFFMRDRRGRLFGYDIDLARDLAKQLGVAVEFNRDAKTYDEISLLVSQRKADVGIANLGRTLARAHLVRFSDPYYHFVHSLLVNRVRLEKLKRRRDAFIALNHPSVILGIETGTSFADLVKRNFSQVKVKKYDSAEKLFRAVDKGEVHFTIRSKAFVRNWLYSQPGAWLNLKYIETDRKQAAGIAVNTEDTHFLSWVNLYIASLKENGYLDSLYSKYLESDEWRNRIGKRK